MPVQSGLDCSTWANLSDMMEASKAQNSRFRVPVWETVKEQDLDAIAGRCMALHKTCRASETHKSPSNSRHVRVRVSGCLSVYGLVASSDQDVAALA